MNNIANSDLSEFRLSVSKTKCFNQCKKQYEFSYILKLPQKERDYHAFGKFCHKVLEDFHLALMKDAEQPLHTLMAKCFKDAKSEFHQMTPEMVKECYSIIDQYLQIFSDKKAKNEMPNVLACEELFKLDIGNNVFLNGAIDLVSLETDGIIK